MNEYKTIVIYTVLWIFFFPALILTFFLMFWLPKCHYQFEERQTHSVMTQQLWQPLLLLLNGVFKNVKTASKYFWFCCLRDMKTAASLVLKYYSEQLNTLRAFLASVCLPIFLVIYCPLVFKKLDSLRQTSKLYSIKQKNRSAD